MPQPLRIEMLIVALIIVGMVVSSIYRHKLTIRYSLLWLVIALCMLLAAAFPGMVLWLCRMVHIEQPSNLIFLLGIMILLLITFRQSELLSCQAEKIDRLTQYISLLRFEQKGTQEPENERDMALRL